MEGTQPAECLNSIRQNLEAMWIPHIALEAWICFVVQSYVPIHVKILGEKT